MTRHLATLRALWPCSYRCRGRLSLSQSSGELQLLLYSRWTKPSPKTAWLRIRRGDCSPNRCPHFGCITGSLSKPAKPVGKARPLGDDPLTWVRVIVTPAVYPRLFEFLHFDIQSTGQKSHCVNTTFWPSQCYVLIRQSDSPCPYQF